jgi:hypothetical protein
VERQFHVRLLFVVTHNWQLATGNWVLATGSCIPYTKVFPKMEMRVTKVFSSPLFFSPSLDHLGHDAPGELRHAETTLSCPIAPMVLSDRPLFDRLPVTYLFRRIYEDDVPRCQISKDCGQLAAQ